MIAIPFPVTPLANTSSSTSFNAICFPSSGDKISTFSLACSLTEISSVVFSGNKSFSWSASKPFNPQVYVKIVATTKETIIEIAYAQIGE